MVEIKSPDKRLSLGDFYSLAQRRAGATKPVQLIGPWLKDDVDRVKRAVGEALEQGGILGSTLPKFLITKSGKARSNQSKGNVAADAVARGLGCNPKRLEVEGLKVSGYPDRRLTLVNPKFECCFEFKATSEWNDRDGNRRVLTSSPSKILNAIRRGELPSPPCHLIGTIFYDGGSGRIQKFRLDFLEPGSVVNVRLEASTSQKFLACGEHKSFVFA